MYRGLISVVIPTFNKSELLETTLNSVLQQTYPCIEVILVDNGSTDDTRIKIDHFLTLHPNIFKAVYMKENLGPSGARNIGIMAAKGKYIFLLDGDDLMMPNKIDIQVQYMELNSSLGLSVTPYVIYGATRRFPLRLISELDPIKLVRRWIGMNGFGGLVESTGCIRRSCLDESLLFDLTFMGSEGLDFTIKWSARFQVGILKYPLTIYRLSHNQLHHDVSAIKENMERVTLKYIDSKSDLDKFVNQQEAFFRLDGIRHKSKLHIILYLFLSWVTFNSSILKMAWWISTRNFRAVIGGHLYRKKVFSLLVSLRNLDTF